MKKKVLIGILFFSIGIGVSLLLDSFLREQIFNIYRWSTDHKIIFIGKGFHFFPSPVYILSFSFSFIFFGFSNIVRKSKGIIKSAIIYLLFFLIAVISISAFDANIKIVVCTACDNGVRRINYNAVNYGLILGSSSLLAVVPSIIHLIKRRIQK